MTKTAEKTVAKTATPTYSIKCGAREAPEQINLVIPSELGYARHAALSCFHALNDGGGNNPTSIDVTVGDASVTVSVSQTPYVHGG